MQKFAGIGLPLQVLEFEHQIETVNGETWAGSQVDVHFYESFSIDSYLFFFDQFLHFIFYKFYALVGKSIFICDWSVRGPFLLIFGVWFLSK